MATIGPVVLTGRQIRALIAHREPFLFVSHAIHNRVGSSITTAAKLGPESVLPVYLQLLEGLGQTSALLIRQVSSTQSHITTRTDQVSKTRLLGLTIKFMFPLPLCTQQMPQYKQKPLPVFAAMRDVRWGNTHSRFLDQHLLFTAELKRAAAARFGVVCARAHVDGAVMCSGELLFSFID